MLTGSADISVLLTMCKRKMYIILYSHRIALKNFGVYLEKVESLLASYVIYKRTCVIIILQLHRYVSV